MQTFKTFTTDRQDTNSEAWQRLLALVDEAARDGRAVFVPASKMPRAMWMEIVTLPATIAKLTQVRELMLYGSNLVAIPPQIGAMTNLRTFVPYTSHRLSWFPYEITRCVALRESTVSTRVLYGNHKTREPFPALPARLPAEWTPTVCSVCAGPFPQRDPLQRWISLQVATAVLPLLVHACSESCIQSLPSPPQGYVDHPHCGGLDVQV